MFKKALHSLYALGSIGLALALTQASLADAGPINHSKDLHAMFKAAKRPKPEQLKPGKIWSCRFFSTNEDNMRSETAFTPYFNFELNDLLTTNVATTYNNFGSQLIDFVSDDSTLLTTDPRGNRSWFARATEKGDLVLESVETDQNANYINNACITSVSREPAKTCGYIFCPAAKVTLAPKAEVSK